MTDLNKLANDIERRALLSSATGFVEGVFVGILETERVHVVAALRAALRCAPPEPAPLGFVLVELDRINTLTERIKALADAGSADAKSLAADAALLLEARRGS